MKSRFFTRTSTVTATFVVLIFLCFLHGCMYYKVQKVAKVTPQDANKYESLNKYLVVHQNKEVWHLSKPDVKGDSISGILSVLPNTHLKYIAASQKGERQYKKNDSAVVSEVHLYLLDSLITKLRADEKVRFACSAVQKAEVYQKDKTRTTLSKVIPLVVGIPIGVGVIVLLLKSSCPLVYVENGGDSTYKFAGEIFGGAVHSSVERNDYMPLPGFQSYGNRYKLKITNGLPEVQYINLAELWIVSHPENVPVLPDRQGVVHSVVKPEPPVDAYSLAKTDLRPLISSKDQSCFLFDEEPSVTGDSCAFNTAFLSFAVPHQADTGKLIVRAGNSLWGDYTYGEFTKLFGSKYAAWMKKQDKEPADRSLRWKQDQRFVLMVYLETSTGWEFVDYFDMIGPLGARDLIMPVNLSRALTTSTPNHDRIVRVKLESGFKFWDLDYAAMDCTPDIRFAADRLQPYSAITESGKDVIQLLTKDDALYYVQNSIGEEGSLLFNNSSVADGNTKSLFLHTKGYYKPVRSYTGSPDYKQLKTFLVPGRFSKFSFENYADFRKNRCVFVSEPNVP